MVVVDVWLRPLLWRVHSGWGGGGKKEKEKKGGTEEGEGEEGRKESRKRVSGGTPVWIRRVTGDGRALAFRPWLIRCDPDAFFLFLSRINSVDNKTKISYSTRTYRLPE